MSEAAVRPVAWRINEWRKAVPLSRSQVYEFLSDGTIRSAKIDGARLILDRPEDFVERFAKPAT
jgi:hypothetical protein